jgi:hypothetical protein
VTTGKHAQLSKIWTEGQAKGQKIACFWGVGAVGAFLRLFASLLQEQEVGPGRIWDLWVGDRIYEVLDHYSRQGGDVDLMCERFHKRVDDVVELF